MNMEEAGHELKVKPPSVLAKTRRKKGSKAAEAQRRAIMFSKVRQSNKGRKQNDKK